MIDRWGREIRIAWPAHHILWIEAAMSLPIGLRTPAYRDIMELTGRTMQAIEGKVGRIYQDRRDAMRREASRARRLALAVPTAIPPPTRAQMMGAR